MAKILDTKSSRAAESTAVSPTPSLIADERLVAIYVAMVKCRMLQQRAATLFQQGKLCADLHSSSGREACAASVGVDLQPEDTLCIAPGDWLPAFVKGLPAEMLFKALARRVDGQSIADEIRKRNILESQADQAAIVGDRGEAVRAAKKPAIVAAFFQYDAASANQWQKVVSAAATKKLPILFVQYTGNDGPPKSLLTGARGKASQALLHGVPAIAVDAADPVALYRVAYEAVTRARHGRGATLLECAAIPIISSADPATDQPVQPPDPVAIMETYLKSKGIQPEHYNRQAVAEFTLDLDLATRFLMP